MPQGLKRFILLLVLSIPFLAYSQEEGIGSCDESCCFTNLSPSGVMISHTHKKHQVMVSYLFMRMGMKNILQGRQRVDDLSVFNNYLMSPQHMVMNMHMVMGMYGISDKITAMLMLNYYDINMSMSMFTSNSNSHNHNHSGGHTEHDDLMLMHANGIGDTKLHILYRLIDHPNHHLVFSAGLSIPTGRVDIKGTEASMYKNQRLPYAMQLGSGSLDILPGINYLYQNNKIAFGTQALPTIRGYYNKIGYKLGNEITINNWFAYLWNDNLSSSFRLESYFAEAIKRKDPTLYTGAEPAANSLNYGGQRMSVLLGSNFYFRRGILKNNRIGVEYGIPIYQNLNGTQMAVNSLLNISWYLTLQ